jgi:hypothetical protein
MTTDPGTSPPTILGFPMGWCEEHDRWELDFGIVPTWISFRSEGLGYQVGTSVGSYALDELPLLIEHLERDLLDLRGSIPPKAPECAVCRGTGTDSDLDREKLALAVSEAIRLSDEYDERHRAREEHLRKSSLLLFEALRFDRDRGVMLLPEEIAWLSAEEVFRQEERVRA